LYINFFLNSEKRQYFVQSSNIPQQTAAALVATLVVWILILISQLKIVGVPKSQEVQSTECSNVGKGQLNIDSKVRNLVTPAGM
jgi:L-asparagine transporter-like permease